MIDRMTPLSEILSQFDSNDPSASERLLPLVYDELRALAAKKLSQEKPGHTLQATALVHEAFLKLANVDHWDSRRHFFAAAAEAMRRILVDQARRKSSLKRGAGRQRCELEFSNVATPEKSAELLALDEALAALASQHAEAAQVVKLRYFVGLSIAEAADIMGISIRSANRLWASARSWLAVEMGVVGDCGHSSSDAP